MNNVKFIPSKILPPQSSPTPPPSLAYENFTPLKKGRKFSSPKCWSIKKCSNPPPLWMFYLLPLLKQDGNHFASLFPVNCDAKQQSSCTKDLNQFSRKLAVNLLCHGPKIFATWAQLSSSLDWTLIFL